MPISLAVTESIRTFAAGFGNETTVLPLLDYYDRTLETALVQGNQVQDLGCSCSCKPFVGANNKVTADTRREDVGSYGKPEDLPKFNA